MRPGIHLPRDHMQGLRCRANRAHTRQSQLDSGRGVPVTGLKTFQVVPTSLGSGRLWWERNTQNGAIAGGREDVI